MLHSTLLPNAANPKRTLGYAEEVRVLALLLVLLCQPYSPLSPRLSAQANVKEPEEINQFFLLDATGEIRPLERQTPEGLMIKGSDSEFRLVQGEPLAFVVKLASDDVDATKIIQFRRLAVKGEARVLETAKKDGTFSGTIPFETTSYGEGSFKIKPKADLGPGEYALRLSNAADSYCFGVDPVKTDLK